MKFGKREQIVVIVLGALGLIALLHMTVFSERAATYRAAYQKAEELLPQASGVVKIADRNRFAKFKEMTNRLQTEYNDAVTSLRLTRPAAFDLAKPADKPGGAGAPPGGPRPGTAGAPRPGAGPRPGGGPGARPGGPPGANRPKEAVSGEDQAAMTARQLQAVIDEIRALRKFDERIVGTEAGKVKALFLGEGIGRSGWNLTGRLPEKIYSEQVKDIGKLVDALREAAQTKGLLELIAADQADLRQEQRGYYDAHLASMGMDTKLYRDTSTGGLASMGEYVPFIHKLNHAMLIEDALSVDPDREISGAKITRKSLLDWLEITPPVKSSGDLKVNELYFVYEQLHALNALLKLMNEQMADDKNPQLFGVRFEDASYLSQKEVLNLAAAEPKGDREKSALAGAGARAGAAPSAPLAGRPIQPPGERDIGLCLPIVMQFRCSNISAWKFIYRVLEVFPLAELDELSFRAVQEGGDVFCQVKFLIVPYLFAVEGGGPKVAPPKPKPGPGSLGMRAAPAASSAGAPATAGGAKLDIPE